LLRRGSTVAQRFAEAKHFGSRINSFSALGLSIAPLRFLSGQQGERVLGRLCATAWSMAAIVVLGAVLPDAVAISSQVVFG
jgi:methyl coenzyme M reductase subunit D